MKPTSETNAATWTTQEWPGNPSLKLECACKLFSHYKPIPVFVFGIDNSFHYCVSAVASSDLSYTGFCTNSKRIQEATQYVDSLSKQNKLFK